MYWCSHYTMVITYDNGEVTQTVGKMDYDVWGYSTRLGVAIVIYN